MKKRLIAAVISTVVVVGTTGVAAAGGLRSTGTSGAIALDWNREILAIVRTPGVQPPTVHSTRDFAILHVAIYDAVVAAEHAGDPLLIDPLPADRHRPARADAAAAAAEAGHDVLAALYPSVESVDGLLATELTAIPDGPAKAEGVRLGGVVAGAVLAQRADDGSDATPPSVPAGTRPGEYRSTPPNFPAPVFTHWAAVTPFVLSAADEFRPSPPPELTSQAYADALDEVQSLGQDTSTTRTADQTLAAKFWNAPIQNYWNEIAQGAAVAHHTDLRRTARLFADLDLALADSAIAMYDAKYAADVWRPVTAIREADTDDNPATVADPAWSPLNTTPADPSYPGAHSVIATAGATVLTAAFGRHDPVAVTSELLPGVTRTFDSYGAAATEAGLSRIFAGVHTRSDHEAGVELGANVAHEVLRRTGGRPR